MVLSTISRKREVRRSPLSDAPEHRVAGMTPRAWIGVLSLVLVVNGAVQLTSAWRDAASEVTAPGTIVTPGCEVKALSGSLSGTVFALPNCLHLAVGTAVRLTIEGGQLVNLHAGSSDFAIAKGQAALDDSSGFSSLALAGVLVLGLSILGTDAWIDRLPRPLRWVTDGWHWLW